MEADGEMMPYGHAIYLGAGWVPPPKKKILRGGATTRAGPPPQGVAIKAKRIDPGGRLGRGRHAVGAGPPKGRGRQGGAAEGAEPPTQEEPYRRTWSEAIQCR